VPVRQVVARELGSFCQTRARLRSPGMRRRSASSGTAYSEGARDGLTPHCAPAPCGYAARRRLGIWLGAIAIVGFSPRLVRSAKMLPAH